MRMKVVLRVHKVWDSINSGVPDEDKNDMAMALLFQSIPETLIMQIGDQETAKAMWDSIKTRHLGAERVREARLQTLSMEFDNMKMNESDSIDNFAGKLSSIASKSAALDEVIDDASHRSFESNGGRGRGGRGRGRGRFNGQYQTPSTEQGSSSRGKVRVKKDRSKIVCYRCDQFGHFASGCPDRVQKGQEANKTEAREIFDDAAYMHQVVFLNEQNLIPKKYETERVEDDAWYLDNGASNHMTGNRSYFLELNENITGRVKFGDGSFVQIKGKGTILFQGKSGDQDLLTEIYYIPELKNNIISLGQATESGCDIRMKHDLLIMYDENRRLLMKVKRSENRLYKI
ncbi:uncharacterized protein LOC143588099 [Bidens hawaiensis]|uniref:uncharacterized protein LOC143588099 n=1 Tax=Bidens hawaiensis TaxID=980011 RepID=UPI004049D556